MILNWVKNTALSIYLRPMKGITMSHSPLQMVDLKSQYNNIRDEVQQALAEVINSCQFINGDIVRTFASNLSDYLDGADVIPCANGTDALQVALMALDLEPGDEVITTPFTFVATAEVIALLRLKPVFVDIDPLTYLMDDNQLESVITDRTKVIIPVHLFGQGANMERIMKLAEAHNLYVIEDNAQAIGADYINKDGSRKKLGTIGHIGTTSFFPSKNLGAYGDGGAIFTGDEELAAKLRAIVNHGMNSQYMYERVGVNSRLDSFQAAVLNVKLKYLNTYSSARLRAANYYSEILSGIEGVLTPKVASHSTHVFHQYTIQLDSGRDAIRAGLNEVGIPTGVYYPLPLHLHTPYMGHGYKAGDFPISEGLSGKVLSLPMHSELTTEIQDFIIAELIKRINH